MSGPDGSSTKETLSCAAGVPDPSEVHGVRSGGDDRRQVRGFPYITTEKRIRKLSSESFFGVIKQIVIIENFHNKKEDEVKKRIKNQGQTEGHVTARQGPGGGEGA